MNRTPAARLAWLCLLGLALLMPLVPADDALVLGKPVIFLGLAVLGMAAVAFDALDRRTAPALGTPVDIALLLFVATALPAGLAAPDPGVARYDLGRVLAGALTFVLAIKVVRTPRDVLWVYAATLASALVIAGFGLVGYRNFLAGSGAEIERSHTLATPFFRHSYLAAQYLVMVFVGGAVLLFEGGLSRGWRRAVTAALVPIGAYLLVIGSRGAYAAILIALVAHLLLRARAAGGRALLTKLAARALLFGIVGAVLLGLATVTDILPGAASHALDRVMLVLDPQATGYNLSRVQIWRDTLRMVADHLILGVGPGGFDAALPTYHPSAALVPHAHNQFLHVLAERGLLGLIAFLFLFRYAWRAAGRGAVHLVADEQRRAPFHAAVAALIAATIYFLFETPLVWAEAGSLLMILLAIMSRAGCDSRERPGRPGFAFAGVLVAASALGIVWPAWLRYSHSARFMVAARDDQAAGFNELLAGNVEAARERLSYALDDLDQADGWFPHRADFPAARAEILAVVGRLDEALAAATLADRRAPNTFRHLAAIGSILFRLGRPADALDPLRRAISANRGPSALDAYVLLGRAYYAVARYDEAWYVFSSLLNQWYHTQRPELLLHAARTLINLDRNLTVARGMLNEYRKTLAPGTTDYVDSLLALIAEKMQRPRREFTR